MTADKNRIQFLGGAGTVTGSKFLVEARGKRILIDCGLFQGVKELRLQNWAPFPVEPASIDAVILTHAHLDHTGYLPILVRAGFKGKIHCTPPTRDLAKIILVDSAQIQVEDAEYANEKGFSKHHPAKPLYTVAEAKAAMLQFQVHHETDWHDLFEGVRFRFSNSGHILGSAFVELKFNGTRITFSGDLGRAHPLLLNPPAPITSTDYLVLESTYGDRVHASTSVLKELAEAVNETVGRGGHLLIPSFAVGRAQDMLHLFAKLKAQKMIPDVPIFLDSPMGIDATEIFLEHSNWHRLGAREVSDLSRVATMVRSWQQSEDIIRAHKPTIVIAGSGMLSGGRVLRHLEARLRDERNTVLLVGYQAAGTRGRLLRDGIGELKMYGQYVPVRARVRELSTLSAHADQRETLEWLGGFTKPPKQTFIVHGEPQASNALRVKIGDALGWSVTVPAQGGSFDLD